MALPNSLQDTLRPVTVVCGHYGAGKTNFCMNLAFGVAAAGMRVTVIDLDVVNPYFRASEQRAQLEACGIRLVAPVFAEAGTSLDVPSLTGAIAPAIESAGANDLVIIDAGGDDVGATALGRFARAISARDYAMLYIANKFRNLVADPEDALENLHEIESASRLHATAIVNNSHLKALTTQADVDAGVAYARDLACMASLPLVATTVAVGLEAPDAYTVSAHVKAPWE